MRLVLTWLWFVSVVSVLVGMALGPLLAGFRRDPPQHEDTHTGGLLCPPPVVPPPSAEDTHTGGLQCPPSVVPPPRVEDTHTGGLQCPPSVVPLEDTHTGGLLCPPSVVPLEDTHTGGLLSPPRCPLPKCRGHKLFCSPVPPCLRCPLPKCRGHNAHSGSLLSRVPFVPVPSEEAGAACGFPSLAGVRTRKSYVVSYDHRTRNASWVLERLSPSVAQYERRRRNNHRFKEDHSVHPYHRATHEDYRGSGFARGHLAAAGNHRWSREAVNDTFYLSNAVPQDPHMNKNAWNDLEKMCRSLTKRYRSVYVYTGPLYLPTEEVDGRLYVRYQVLLPNHVAVPTHLFKVLVLERWDGGVELRSYVMPNAPVEDRIPLRRFRVPVEYVERASGLLYVPNKS